VRLLIVGFLLGTFALQNMPQLPRLAFASPWSWCVIPLFGATLLLWIQSRANSNSNADADFSVRMPNIVCDILAKLAMLLCGVMLGFGYADWRADVRTIDELASEWEGVDVEIIGVVASLPVLNERGTRFEFDIERVPRSSSTGSAKLPQHVSLNWYTERARKGVDAVPPPEIKPGERWQFVVRLRRPHGTVNPHGYDFEAFALEHNIRATGYIRVQKNAPEVNRKLDDFVGESGLGVKARVNRLRFRIRDRMNAALKDQPYRGVLVALAIGEQTAIPADEWKVFWRTGVGHLISISGLHITMIAMMFYALCFWMWARIPALALRLPAQRAAVLAGAFAALSYSLIAGFAVPTQRTLFMLAAIGMALWMGRATSATRILSWALLAVLLFDPWAVLAPGFWLSFGAVASIFYVTAHRTGQLSTLKGAALTQVAVTLGLLPMTLALFQEVSLISPIANAFAIPLVSLVVVPITLAGAVLPFDFLLTLAHEIMAWCYAALAWLAETPNAVWQSHAPLPWTIVFALIGCAWMLLPRGVAPRWLGAAFVLPMFVLLPPTPKPGEVWITLLDVGQGLATVVRTANHTLVYDTGPRYNPDADSGNRIVVPYLRGEGIRVLDALIVTHADEDHAGGAKSIIDMRNPKWVMTSMDRTNEKNIETLKNAAEVMRCDTRDTWHWDGIDFDILHPTKDDYADENRKTNDLGCVLKIIAPGGTVLMTADIEKKSEAELVERNADDPAALKADVLVMPHHGSKTSSTEEFLDAVRPQVVLIPVGYRNRFRHPHPDVMARYARRGIKAYRTDEAGALTLKLGSTANTKIEVKSHRLERRRYWIDLPMADMTVD
jgi:competence protein ComEC